MKVFLGGTCNDSSWRNELEGLLEVDYFNPVVDDWDDDAYQNELKEKEICDVMLFHITPLMTGVFSIAEAVESVFNGNKITIFSYQEEDCDKSFDEFQIKSLDATGDIIEKNRGIFIKNMSMSEISEIINKVKGS